MNQTTNAISITMRRGVNPIGIIATTAIGGILAILACTDTALAACMDYGPCSFPQNGVSFRLTSFNPTTFALYDIRDLYNQTGLTDFEVVVNIGNGETKTFEYPGSTFSPDPNLTTLFSYNGTSGPGSTGYYQFRRDNFGQSIIDAYFTKDGVKSVPEPLTFFGSMIALGGSIVFKRKLTKKNKEDSARV